MGHEYRSFEFNSIIDYFISNPQYITNEVKEKPKQVIMNKNIIINNLYINKPPKVELINPVMFLN